MPKTPNQRLRHLCRSSYSIAFGIPIAYWVDFSVFHVAADFPHYISQCILKFSILKCLSCLDFLIFLNFKCHIMEKFSEYLKTKDCRTSWPLVTFHHKMKPQNICLLCIVLIKAYWGHKLVIRFPYYQRYPSHYGPIMDLVFKYINQHMFYVNSNFFFILIFFI